jgi:predicted hydrocarbon binding protein
MMPINNFNNTKIKIFSTTKGIKIVDSPIKIQILNMLDGQVSEADIVNKTGKSKSTISVHLKNLIDEGIISFKSHPMDRRSKLFYILADYIGEIYPDKIIYKSPNIECELNNQEQLYIELFRQYKSILLVHGLQLEPLEVETGKKIGKEIYKSFEFDTFDELLDLIIEKFEELGLGHIKTSSDKPLILKNNNCHECKNLQYNMPICNIIK